MGMTIGLTMNATEMSRRMSGMGGPPPQGRGGPDQLIEDAAKAIGISKGDLQSQLKSGASIADVAKASGVALDDMKSRMSETISARLSTAVSGGGLTKTDADAMKADMTGRLDVALAQKGMRGPGGGQRPAGAPPPPPGGSGGSGEQLIADLAASTGTSVSALLGDLASGKSLSDVASANGKTTDQVKASMLEYLKKRLDEPSATGKSADTTTSVIVARASAFLDAAMNQPGSLLGRGIAA
jgi:hypothetical protein